MTYLGLDIGDRRIGIAVSTGGILAGGLETYTRTSLKNDVLHIIMLVKMYQADRIIVGLPKHLNGQEHVQAEKNEELCCALRAEGCRIEYMDERLTSAAAERVMLEADLSRKKRKQNIDKLAAVIILQDYLDRKNNREGIL